MSVDEVLEDGVVLDVLLLLLGLLLLDDEDEDGWLVEDVEGVSELVELEVLEELE